ncbi:porin [Chitiniphilus shinanonensis]|uniref:porin n=1 Tax=Chitiniphilus shinanonensis TaxID=553088 RepID=UPI003046C452
MKTRMFLAAAVAACFATPAFAEVKIGGSAEMDFFYLTGPKTFNEEIAIVVNVDGTDKLDSGDTLKWRLAQKVATDYRYDSWGNREAWIGYAGDWGELRFGNQFSNTYLLADWPYGVKGLGNVMADTVVAVGGQFVSYFSPNFNGFNFAVQYDLSLGGKDGIAYDLTANYSNGGFHANAGYYTTEDATTSFAGNGEGHGLTYSEGTDNGYWLVGARYLMDNGWQFAGAYRSTTLDSPGAEREQDQYLLRVGYNFGKHGLSLGYQQMLDSKLNGDKVNDGVQQVAAQWTYSLSKQSEAFVQARYQKFDGANPVAGFGFDGRQADDDNSARILVGTWTGF